jgi:23S rRNA pseudouridine955/2504/2580 synthase
MAFKLNKNDITIYLAGEHDAGQRLDNLLFRLIKNVPKAYIYKIIRSGQVRINKKRSECHTKLIINDVVRIPPIFDYQQPTTSAPIISKTKYLLPTIFEDEHFLIINKPSGIACHGGSGISFGVIEQLRQQQDFKFLELAHRLDRGTSGILVLAKRRQALILLQQLMQTNKVSKHYLTLCCGRWELNSKTVHLPLYKYSTKDGKRMVKVDLKYGQPAVTKFHVIKKFADFTLLDAKLETGKTHQIRVHLQALNQPIAGDDKYGNFEHNKQLIKIGLNRLFLHAYKMEFIHPISNHPINLTAKLPNDLQQFMDSLI